MKNKVKLLIIVGGLGIIVAIVIILLSQMQITAEYSNEYNQIFGEFTADTTSVLLKGKKENSCYSPVSLFATMTLLAEVTEGESRQEILECLGVKSIEKLQNIYSEMEKSVTMLERIEEENDKNKNLKYTEIDQSGPSVIMLANSLWIEKELLDDSSNDIIEACKEKLNCEIFKCDSLQKREIDSWVTEKTNNIINDIASGDEDDIALINTIYYKSSWFEKLNKNVDKNFHLENGENIKVDYLYCNEAKLNFKECNDYTMVEMPLKSGEMILVLPEKKLDKLITCNKMNEIISIATSESMQEGLVDVSFPMFEIEDSFGTMIKDTLEVLGVKKVYDPSCEWNISSKMKDTSVNIEQSTRIIVNENGIEAAAATKAAAYISAKKDIDLAISFDRPFLYILMKDGVPLFIGTVYNPAE